MLSSPTTFYPNQHLSLQPIPSVHPNQPPKPPLSSSSDMMITKISTLDGKTSNTLSVPESEALVRECIIVCAYILMNSVTSRSFRACRFHSSETPRMRREHTTQVHILLAVTVEKKVCTITVWQALSSWCLATSLSHNVPLVGVIFALFGPLQICHIRRHAKGTLYDWLHAHITTLIQSRFDRFFFSEGRRVSGERES